jgi:4a-hydroxytetrahydrobiopterin dehydratase
MARKVRRMAEFFQSHADTVVPDPYEGGAAGFEQVLDLLEDGCQGLLSHLLTPDALSRCVPQWQKLADQPALQREFEFASFMEAMAFVQLVAIHAEAHQHHPEIWNVYHRVRLTLTTHDANGLTVKDLALARAIDDCRVAS